MEWCLQLEAVGDSFTNVVKLNYYCVDSVASTDLPALRDIRDRLVNTGAPSLHDRLRKPTGSAGVAHRDRSHRGRMNICELSQESGRSV